MVKWYLIWSQTIEVVVLFWPQNENSKSKEEEIQKNKNIGLNCDWDIKNSWRISFRSFKTLLNENFKCEKYLLTLRANCPVVLDSKQQKEIFEKATIKVVAENI